MVKSERMPWEWHLLGILDGSENGIATLHEIYCCIEEERASTAKTDPQITNPDLFATDPRFGNRPTYQHTVRGCLAAYKKQGLVERIDIGVYRITDKGQARLQWYNEKY